MVNEFPVFIKLNNEENFGKQAKWTYYSSSELNKLKKWLIITLADINLNLDQDYELTVSENNFLIRKFPTFGTKGSKGNVSKFNSSYDNSTLFSTRHFNRNKMSSS